MAHDGAPPEWRGPGWRAGGELRLRTSGVGLRPQLEKKIQKQLPGNRFNSKACARGTHGRGRRGGEEDEGEESELPLQADKQIGRLLEGARRSLLHAQHTMLQPNGSGRRHIIYRSKRCLMAWDHERAFRVPLQLQRRKVYEAAKLSSGSPHAQKLSSVTSNSLHTLRDFNCQWRCRFLSLYGPGGLQMGEGRKNLSSGKVSDILERETKLSKLWKAKKIDEFIQVS
eukprot:764791-Hanusia_phi.AAC.4